VIVSVNTDIPSSDIIDAFNESLSLISNRKFPDAYTIILCLLKEFPTRDSLLSNAVVCVANSETVDEIPLISIIEDLEEMLVERYFPPICTALLKRQELNLQAVLKLLRINAERCCSMFNSAEILPEITASELVIDEHELAGSTKYLRVLSKTYAEKRLWKDALTFLSPAFDHGLLDDSGLSDFFVLHQRLGRYEDAISIFQKYLAGVADLSDSVIAIYVGCAIKGGHSIAAVDWLHSVGFCNDAVRNGYHETEILRCVLYTDLGMWVEAETLSEALLGSFPDNSNCWNAKASFLLKLDRLEEASVAVERSIDLDSQNAAALYNRASCKALLGDHSSAIQDYETAMSMVGGLDPDRATYFLGVAYLRTGRLAEGFKCYEKRAIDWNDIEARLDAVSIPGSKLSRVCETPQRRNFGDVLIVGEQGIGDVLVVLRFVSECVDRGIFKSATINYKPKIWSIAKHCFSNLNFIHKDQLDRQQTFDCYELLYSVPSVLINRGVKLDLKKSSLSFGCFSPKGFGLTWASKNKQFGDLKNLELKDLIQALRRVFGREVQLYNFQHGDAATAEFNMALIELDGNLDALNILPFDPAEDFLSVVEFCRANNVGFFGASNTMMHIAGSASLPGIVIPPQNSRALLWYWSLCEQNCRSKWYPSIKVAQSLEVAEEMLSCWKRDFRGKN